VVPLQRVDAFAAVAADYYEQYVMNRAAELQEIEKRAAELAWLYGVEPEAGG
jgi:hypothetical protein